MRNVEKTQLLFASAAALLVSSAPLAQVNEEVNSRPDPYVMDQDFFKMPQGMGWLHASFDINCRRVLTERIHSAPSSWIT